MAALIATPLTGERFVCVCCFMEERRDVDKSPADLHMSCGHGVCNPHWEAGAKHRCGGPIFGNAVER